MKFKFYEDASHGWVAVPRELLKKYCVAGLISAFSFERGDTVYLEEDCDAPAFIAAARAAGQSVELESITADFHSFIRSCAPYKAE